jgi:oligopeptide transport system permease protein
VSGIGRALLAVAVVAAAFLLLWWALELVEAAWLTLGITLVVSTSWWPRMMVRCVGALLLGALLVLFLRGTMDLLFVIALGVLVTALAYAYLPSRALRRVCFTVPSLVVLIYVTTLFMYLAPGNPFRSEKKATPQVEEQLRKIYKVPPNATDFFLVYMGNLLEDGSLGPSVKVQGRTVNEVILPALPVSMSLGLTALIIASVLGISLGMRAGLRPNSGSDHASMGLAMVGISLPNFVIGAGLMIVFALQLDWLPVAGWGGYRHLLLPAITLALPYAAYMARLARTGTIEVMQQDFIRTARAKGLSERRVIFKHGLRASLTPIVTMFGMDVALLIGGAVITETVFNFQGLGAWAITSTFQEDLPAVVGVVLVGAVAVALFNLIVDVLYAYLDPRVRYQ